MTRVLDFRTIARELDNKVDLTQVATQTSSGVMSVEDKTKLDGVARGANNYVHPSTDGNKHIPANGTNNKGKFLMSTDVAGKYVWEEVIQDGVNIYRDITLTADNGTHYLLGVSRVGKLTTEVVDSVSKRHNNLILTDENGSNWKVKVSNEGRLLTESTSETSVYKNHIYLQSALPEGSIYRLGVLSDGSLTTVTLYDNIIDDERSSSYTTYSSMKLNNIIEEFKNIKPKANSIDDLYLAAFFDSDDDTETFLYISNDGINFNRISDKPLGTYRDCDIIFYKGNFYIFSTQELGSNISDFKVLVTDNLRTWKEYRINVGLRDDGNNKVWAPEVFIDTDGKMYLILSKQVGEMTDIKTNERLGDFRPYIVEVTNLEKLEFGTPREIILDNNNKIDGHIVKKDNKYFLFIKKEGNEGSKLNGRIEIWESVDLHSWRNITYAIPSFSNNVFEAPCVEEVKGQYYLYCDNCDNSLESYYYYATSTDLINWSPIKRLHADPVTVRHGSIRKIKDYDGKRIIQNALNHSIIDNSNKNLSLYNKSIFLHENTSRIQNKYIHLFSIKTVHNYKSCSLTFNLTDVQSSLINLDFNIMIHRMENEDKISTSINVLNLDQGGWGDHERVKTVQNGDTISVFFEVGTLKNCTPVMNIISYSNYTFKLNLERKILDSIPTGVAKTPQFSRPRIKEFVFPKQKTIKFRGYIRNGLIKITGHANTVDEFIYYGITVLNGELKLIKLFENSAEISMTYKLYEQGRQDLYEIELTTNNEYSIVNIELPILSYIIE